MQRAWWKAGRIGTACLWAGTLAVFMAMLAMHGGGCDLPSYLDFELPEVDVIDHGIYPASGTPIDTLDVRTKAVSINFSSPPRPIEKTRTIPSTVGTVFGFRFETWLQVPYDVRAPARFRIEHPPINGLTETIYDTEIPQGEVLGAFYSLDTEAEAVAGEWVIQVLYDGDMLVERRFTLE